jgi:hypothetical protein
MAITLVMMAAVVTLFANLSGSIRNRRAVIELSGQLRQVRQRLAADLAGCTIPVTEAGIVPWQRAGEGIGYFEIFEGRWSDADPSRLVDGNPDNGEIDYATSLIPSAGNPQILLPRQSNDERPSRLNDVTNGGALGDWDDILALTVRSDEPFTAEVNNQIVESHLAEVIWYAIEHENGPEPGMRSIYRRVLLIAPWLNIGENDRDEISAHFDPQSRRWVPNTLADLTRREYRFQHEFDPDDPDLDYPHEMDEGDVRDEDPDLLMLSNALAFDVRVYDPGAPLFEIAGTVVQPGDPAWDAAASSAGAAAAGYGAYVDLGWDNNGDYVAPFNTTVPQPLFQQERAVGWHPSLPNVLRRTPATYDTWSWHYENDGIDQELLLEDTFSQETPPPVFEPWRKNVIDQGTNGLDDDGINGVDDVGERESAPPYNVPLRGVKVILRVYESDARQVREASVTGSFVP